MAVEVDDDGGGRRAATAVPADSSRGGSGAHHPPPPKNVERNILEYIDRKTKDTFFTTNLL
jgi:hypothetical protein